MAKPKPVDFDMDKATAMIGASPLSPDQVAAGVAGGIIERLHELGEINLETLAFAQLDHFANRLDEGALTADQVGEYFEKSGEKTVGIPVSYFRAIGAGWRRYMGGGDRGDARRSIQG